MPMFVCVVCIGFRGVTVVVVVVGTGETPWVRGEVLKVFALLVLPAPPVK